MIKDIIKQIKKDKLIDWNNISKIFEIELEKRNEHICDSHLFCWGRYIKGQGIEVQKGALPEYKLVTALYLLNFTETTSFSLYREDFDGKVREDIKQIIKRVDNKTRARILRLRKKLDFQKLFTEPRL